MLGYSLAVLAGLSLGLMGGGGSILTVPILVYAVGLDAKISIALSLAIVACTSFIGVIGHYRAGNVDLKIATIFAPIAMMGTFLGAKLAMYMSGQTQLLIFALIMLGASYSMIKPKKKRAREDDPHKRPNTPLIAIEAMVVGIITGIVGVGGGFLIVPSLVVLAGIGMKKAVGTSLFIISLNSLTGFAGYLEHIDVPWKFLSVFIAFSGIGILLGSYLVRFIPQERLRKSFGYFLIVMGLFILYKNGNTLLLSAT